MLTTASSSTSWRWLTSGLLIACSGLTLAESTTITPARLHQGLTWDYCGPRPPTLAPLEPTVPDQTVPIAIDAGALRYDRATAVVELFDGVRIEQGTQRIESATLRWHRLTQRLETEQPIFLQHNGLRIVGQNAQIALDATEGQIEQAWYRLSGQANLHGYAERIRLLDADHAELEQVTYTSCPPDQGGWSLVADSLALDQVSGRGVARQVRFKLGEQPVFYSPYVDFPLDNRRQSGLLLPSVRTSSDNTIDITQPYYLNLAPNRDLTLYPRYTSRRGLIFGTELRYLTHHDRGRVHAELIPNDPHHPDISTRGALQFDQTGHWGSRWRTELNYSLVSDDRYLEDLGTNLQLTSTRRLLQRAQLSYQGDQWLLLGRVEAFQTLDRNIAPEDRPYGRLPQLQLSLQPRSLIGGLHGQLHAEYDYFDHRHRVYGQRLAMQPRLSWPQRRSYGHLIPGAELLLSGYALEHTASGQANSPTQAIPSFDLDGQLVFERPVSWGQQPAVQTLEPRLFYLYTPYQDQSDLPVFDSSELSFSFANLFRNNRFTGYDRRGDANQLTLALTSRTLSSHSGQEWLRASIGHLVHFSAHRVQIDDIPAYHGGTPFAGELAARLWDNWRARASVQWDAQDRHDIWPKRALALHYRDDAQRRVLNLAYRYDKGHRRISRYEDTDVSLRWPLTQHSELVGRWLYSLEHDHTMEAVAGVAFGRCCWRVQLVGRHFKNRPQSAGDTSVMLQLQLAGLGTLGHSIDQFLNQEIHGYSTY